MSFPRNRMLLSVNNLRNGESICVTSMHSFEMDYEGNVFVNGFASGCGVFFRDVPYTYVLVSKINDTLYGNFSHIENWTPLPQHYPTDSYCPLVVTGLSEDE